MTNQTPSPPKHITPENMGAGGVRFFGTRIWPFKGWSRTFIPFLLSAFIIFIATNVHAAWHDVKYQYRKAITLDGTQITGNLSSFPVLISFPVLPIPLPTPLLQQGR